MNRSTVERCTVSFFRRGLNTGPDVRLVNVDGHACVVKDWRRLPPLRRLLGRFMLRREYAFLNRLEGLSGIPRVYGFPDADSLAIEYLEGQTVSAVHPGLFAGYFDRLQSLVEALHARGIAHGDLDQEDNIIVGADGAAAIIDFGGAWRQRPWSPLNIYYELLRRHDLQCVNRLREVFRVETDTAVPPPPPPLSWWQREILIGLRKMQRTTPAWRQ